MSEKSKETENKILEWVSEALDLRHGSGDDPEGPIPSNFENMGYVEVSHVLYRVKTRSDRVDALLAKATQAKARARRAQEEAKFVAEVAYDKATQQHAAHRTREFVTAREKHADAALSSFEDRRAAHLSARLVSVTTEAYDVITQVHWQLGEIRKDLRAILHSLQFSSRLEQ